MGGGVERSQAYSHQVVSPQLTLEVAVSIMTRIRSKIVVSREGGLIWLEMQFQ